MKRVLIGLSFLTLMGGCSNDSNNDNENNVKDSIIKIDLANKFVNAQITESGVKYLFLEKGTGKKLNPGDNVKFNYIGKLRDGTVFESSYDYGSAFVYKVDNNSVIIGLKDAISLLNVGDKALVYIPSELAYSNSGSGTIPPNSDLIFQIDIIEVVPPPEPLDLSKAKKQVTESGLVYYIVKESKGEVPQVGDVVFVQYTGMLENGEIFDSSIESGNPFGFELGKHQVIKGWDEGIALLKVGEKARFIIPPELGYGDETIGSIPPNSTLTFDVELVSIQKNK